MIRTSPLEPWVAGVIRAGTLIAAVVLALGIVLRSDALDWTGLLLLTLTPAVQVVVAAGIFIRQREPRYVAASVAAFVVLLTAFGLAAILGR